MKKILWSLTITLLLLLPLAACAETTTLLMYMCGTDLQEDCVEDLWEMSSVDLPEEVNVVVLAGGASEWSDDRLTPNTLNRFTIENGEFANLTDIGHASMGNLSTLLDFMRFGVEEYPADRYGLVMWNHGGGATTGVCFDETAEDDYMSMSEINDALYEFQQLSGESFRWDFIGFDACLMASYEVAMHIAPYADYMVASEELEPSWGWSYDSWLDVLAQDPSIPTLDMCKTIADSFVDYCLSMNPDDYLSLSVISLPDMWPVAEAMEELSAYLITDLQQGELSAISRERQRMYAFGEFSDDSSDMIDMEAFLAAYEQASPLSTQKVRSALERAVKYNAGTDQFEYRCGLSLLMPLTTREYFGDYIQDYDATGRMKNYTDFITGYAELMNGSDYVFSVQAPERLDAVAMNNPAFSDSFTTFHPVSGLTDQDNPTSGQTTPGQTEPPSVQGAMPEGFDPDATYAYSLQLSEEDLQNLSYVEGMLYMDISDDETEAYVDLGYLQNAWVDWSGGMVYSMFNGEWPTLNGQLVAMYDQIKTQAIRRSVIPASINGVDGYLAVAFTKDHPQGIVIGYSEGYDESGKPARGITLLKNGDIIIPSYDLLYNDGSGSEEYATSTFYGDPITYDAEGFTMGSELLTGQDVNYLYCFCLNDIFGDYQLSEMIGFE